MPARLALAHVCLWVLMCVRSYVEMQTDDISELMSHSVEPSLHPRRFVNQYEFTGVCVCVCVCACVYMSIGSIFSLR